MKTKTRVPTFDPSSWAAGQTIWIFERVFPRAFPIELIERVADFGKAGWKVRFENGLEGILLDRDLFGFDCETDELKALLRLQRMARETNRKEKKRESEADQG
jgi:hypothetical protein